MTTSRHNRLLKFSELCTDQGDKTPWFYHLREKIDRNGTKCFKNDVFVR